MSLELEPFITDYLLSYNGRNIEISRFDNHRRRMWPNKGWSVADPCGSSDITNHMYLWPDGSWKYKQACIYASADAAWRALHNSTKTAIEG